MLRVGLWPDSFTLFLSPILHCPGFSLLFVIHAVYKHVHSLARVFAINLYACQRLLELVRAVTFATLSATNRTTWAAPSMFVQLQLSLKSVT